ncbi:MAG: hypothetical protein WBL84_15270, partial [Xanthobacteraceae bacterium]
MPALTSARRRLIEINEARQSLCELFHHDAEQEKLDGIIAQQAIGCRPCGHSPDGRHRQTQQLTGDVIGELANNGKTFK